MGRNKRNENLKESVQRLKNLPQTAPNNKYELLLSNSTKKLDQAIFKNFRDFFVEAKGMINNLKSW